MLARGPFRKPSLGEIRALLYGFLLASIGNHFLHFIVSWRILLADERGAASPRKRSYCRFGESFDVLPFTVTKRREVDAWKSELAHKFGEIKNPPASRQRALFSRFDVVDTAPFS